MVVALPVAIKNRCRRYWRKWLHDIAGLLMSQGITGIPSDPIVGAVCCGTQAQLSELYSTYNSHGYVRKQYVFAFCHTRAEHLDEYSCDR